MKIIVDSVVNNCMDKDSLSQSFILPQLNNPKVGPDSLLSAGLSDQLCARRGGHRALMRRGEQEADGLDLSTQLFKKAEKFYKISNHVLYLSIKINYWNLKSIKIYAKYIDLIFLLSNNKLYAFFI